MTCTCGLGKYPERCDEHPLHYFTHKAEIDLIELYESGPANDRDYWLFQIDTAIKHLVKCAKNEAIKDERRLLGKILQDIIGELNG